MGADSFVYRAVDRRLSDEGSAARVAIKIHDSGASTLKEAIAARRVHHDHVVQILDSGETENGESFLVCELVAGGDLSEADVPMNPRRACRLMAEVAEGIQALHNAGLVHADLKPQNILLTERGTSKIADFNLASGIDTPRKGGNRAFAAPESLDDAGAAPPSDIYALGGILYYLLTGRLPNGETREDIERRLRNGPPPQAPGISRDLDRICLRALEADPADRYPSAAQFAEDLRRWLAHEPIPWLPTPVPRRALLWMRRHPVHATIAFALLVIGSGGVAGALIQRERVARIRAVEAARAEQRAVELNEQTKRSLRQLFLMASVQSSRATRNPRSTIIPAMVWLDYLSSLDVLDDDGHQIGVDMRIQRLGDFLRKMEAGGRTHHIDARIAAFVLAYTFIQSGATQDARRIIEAYLLPWLNELDERDPVAVTIAAMDHATSTMLDPNLPDAEKLAILRSELDRVSNLDDCREAGDLLRAAIERLRESPDDDRTAPSPE